MAIPAGMTAWYNLMYTHRSQLRMAVKTIRNVASTPPYPACAVTVDVDTHKAREPQAKPANVPRMVMIVPSI
jgi:hypothetical protein